MSLRTTEQQMRRSLAALFALCVTTIVVVVVMFFYVAADARDRSRHNRELIYLNCVTGQKAWDSRHEIILAITETVVYPPTDDPVVKAAEDAGNKFYLAQRAKLLKGADGRPTC